MDIESRGRIEADSTREHALDVGGDTLQTSDDRDLIRLGKRPVLKRNFGFTSILGFSCTVLVTWEGMLMFVVSTSSLINGGPAGLIWGFLITWIGTLSAFSVMAELASMAPTSAGQHHWVAMLAPDSSRRFLSYITGWLTVIGWQAVAASAAYLIGSLLQSIIIMLRTDYTAQLWQTMLIVWAILAFCVFINTVATKTLAYFEGVILILYILGFFAILIPLVYLAPHGDGALFSTFFNGGTWPTQGLSFMIGLPSTIFSLIGADSAIHMAEEIRNASVVVPRAVITSLVLNGSMGFAMVIAYVFCMGDVEATIASAETLGYPFLYVFQQGTRSNAGAAVMGLIIFILGVCCSVGVLAASSRMLWSLARDRGVPFWKHLTMLDGRTSIPVYTIIVTTLISMLLSLITLGSTVAFNNIVNLSVAGLYPSYWLSCALLLWRRLQPKGIQPHEPSVTKVGPGSLFWGPWRIPGMFGILNNIFACCYLLLLWFWAFWPPATPVTPASMNYSVLTFGVAVLFAVAWYFLRGKLVYNGPVREVEL